MSNYFDSTSKENKGILSYFEDKSWLIIESSISVRSSLKKSLTQIGSKQLNMSDADNLKAAIEIIRIKKPDYILTNKHFVGGNYSDLFFEHLQSNPNRLNSGFYVITEENSFSEVALALTYDMDGLVSFPFTAGTVISAIIQGAKNKIAPDKYLQKLYSGIEQYLSKNYDFAESFFHEAVALNPYPYEAFYYLGEIASAQDDAHKAIDYLEQATVANENHFKTLYALSKLYYKVGEYKKSYDVAGILTRKYPTPPDFIPDLIRLSVINKKYSDISNYYKMFTKISNPSPETQKYISVGMATLGMYLAKNEESEKAINALTYALSHSSGKYEILESIYKSFEMLNRLDFFLQELSKVDFSLWPESAEGFYFYALHKTSTDDQVVLSVGEKLLRKKVLNVYVEIGMIERGITARRKLGTIESLVFDAIKKYPNHSDEFEKILQVARGTLEI